MGIFFGIYLCWLAAEDVREQRISVWKLAIGFFLLFAWKLARAGHPGQCGLVRDLLPGAAALALSALTDERLGYGDGVVLLLVGLRLGMWVCIWMTAAALCFASFYGMMRLACYGRERVRIAWLPFLTIAYWCYWGICRSGG